MHIYIQLTNVPSYSNTLTKTLGGPVIYIHTHLYESLYRGRYGPNTKMHSSSPNIETDTCALRES